MASLDSLNLLFLAENHLPHRGGSRVYYHQLFRYLAPRHHMTLVTRELDNAAEFDSGQSYNIVRVPFKTSNILRALRLQELSILQALYAVGSRLCREQRIDMILCDPGICGLAGRFLKVAHSVPFGVFTFDQPFQRNRRFFPAIERWIYREADMILTASQYAWDMAYDFIGMDKPVAVIHPGLEEEQFSADDMSDELRAKWNLENKRILLTISRLEPQKGHHLVIRALPRILEQEPDAVYVIGGSGSQELQLRELVKDLQLENHVRFLGLVPDEELRPWYAAAEVCLLISCPAPTGEIQEGFGIANIEAQALGTPVISSNIGGVPEGVRDGVTGFLIDPDDSDALVERVLRILREPGLAQRMGEAGQDFTKEHFRAREKSAEFVKAIQDRLAID